MNAKPYLIPADSVVFEEEIKKSRFITYLAHTPDIESAKAFVDSIKQKHADARHNCWAFAAGRPEDSMKWGFSDDGEPSGTAGKPILSQLSGSGIGEIGAVVTRYFGGIKLGTGGLVKAYGGGVQQALKLVKTRTKKITTKMVVSMEYGFVPVFRSILFQFEGQELDAHYTDTVELLIEIEVLNLNEFKALVINRSGAKAIIRTLEQNKAE